MNVRAHDAVILEQVYILTHHRFRLKPWEKLLRHELDANQVMLQFETYQVKELVREDRYQKKGVRLVGITRNPDTSRWSVTFDETAWDENFEPYVFEKRGRRKTVDEFKDQREWEKLCHRPGTHKTPLDSYERVLDGPTTSKMERYW